MSELRPTPARLSLLIDVYAHNVIDGDVSLDERDHGRAWLCQPGEPIVNVTARVRELERAGWIEQREGKPHWDLTAAGRAALKLVTISGGAA